MDLGRDFEPFSFTVREMSEMESRLCKATKERGGNDVVVAATEICTVTKCKRVKRNFPQINLTT